MTMKFALLKSKEMWIMDSGASGHSTNCLDGATEIRESGSESIGHSGSATKTSKTISIPGMFVQKDGTRGIKATVRIRWITGRYASYL